MHTQKKVTSKLSLLSLVIFAITGFSLALFGNTFLPANTNAADPTDTCVKPTTPAEKKAAEKAVNPECVKTTKVALTDKDAEKAGFTKRSGDDIVAKTLNGVYSVVAIVAVIVIVLAGIRMITADGDSTKFAAARQTIIYAVVGLAVVGSAFIITGIVQGIGTK